MLTVFFSTLLVTSAVWWLYKSRKPASLPPGPTSLPVFGGILSIGGGDIRDAFRHMAQKYGDIFTLDLGSQRTIVLASYASIREALVTKATAFSGRPVTSFTKDAGLEKGVTPTEGVVWKEHRRFLTNIFRELGVGRQAYEPNILDEMEYFLQVLREHCDKPFNPKSLLLKATYNVICRAIFGQRYDYSDPYLLFHLETLDSNATVMRNSALLEVFPFLKWIPGDRFGFATFKRNLKTTFASIEEKISQHRLHRTDDMQRDIIYAYLDEEESAKNIETHVFSDEQLRPMATQLSAAGTETTAVTLISALLHMLYYPDVMKRVQDEIDDVIGPSRMPSMSDVRGLPYTVAVLLEVQRMGDIVPFGIPHRTTREVRLRDYVIPAKTQVFAMLHAAHRDPKVYTNPYQFNPERFIAGDKPAEDPPIPFSLGPRRCPGENLAHMEIFLFFVTLMQTFHIRSVPGYTLPELLGPPGLSACPKPFELIFEERHAAVEAC